ncbi:hypothetical protein K432DRAFT_454091 [Lepidopterella palustris CBS 459.81]|uniref:Uncharacterized protein n=1 Tax=Lepidopterella palustris CBS 459.81 TaxID=1314670 RepID=A0A8E2EAB2_9PEZI|nr:hypothetical protein K432DRAFT_454091 [Lepidopterella palustris CBS 459.81]
MLNANTVMLRGTKILSWIAIALVPILMGMDVLPLGLDELRDMDEFKDSNEPENDFSIRLSVWVMWEARTRAIMRLEPFEYGIIQHIYNFKLRRHKDPRDMIYAILPLCHDVSELNIKPDYSLSTEEVYTCTARRMIEVCQHLDVLGSAQFGFDPVTRNINLPTWVPDWGSPRDQAFVPPDHHRASQDTQIRGHISANSELLVDGIAIDIISLYKATFHWDLDYLIFPKNREKFRPNYNFFKRTMQQLAKEFRNLQAGDDKTATRYSEQGGLDFFEPGENKSIQQKKEPDYSRSAFYFSSLHPKTTGEEFQTLMTFLKRQYEDGESPESVADQQMVATVGKFAEYSRLKNRSIHLTKSGNVCVGARDAKEGGLVVLLFGGKTLYILRPTGDKYQYMGDAFMHGLSGAVFVSYLGS